MRRGAAATITAGVLLLAACDRDEPALPPAPAPSVAPIDMPASATPTVDPEATSGLTIGTAAVTLTGVVNVSETYPGLGLPSVWAVPPEAFSITWQGAGQRSMSLGGTSFTAQQPTSPERVLAFVVRAPDGPIAFASQAGECLVTISPALPDRMGGSFLCSAITGEGDDGASVTVMAQGSFSAE